MFGIIGEFPFFYVIIAASAVGLMVSTIITQFEPRLRARRVRKVAALYQDRRTLSLWEAACLWVEVEPVYPLVDQEAQAKLSRLKEAVRHHQLVCTWLPPMTMIHDTFWGIRDKTPTDHQEVSLVALRRYAEKISNVPLFLRHVSLPVESPKKEGNEKLSDRSTD